MKYLVFQAQQILRFEFQELKIHDKKEIFYPFLGKKYISELVSPPKLVYQFLKFPFCQMKYPF